MLSVLRIQIQYLYTIQYFYLGYTNTLDKKELCVNFTICNTSEYILCAIFIRYDYTLNANVDILTKQL